MDANIGGAQDFTRPAMQRTGGQRFRTIDGEPRSPSTAANSVSFTANSCSSASASASATGHSKHPLSSLAAAVDKKSRVFFRKSQLKARKIKQYLDQINEYEFPPEYPQTEEFDVDASLSLSSSSSLDDFSSLRLAAGNAIKPYQINASTANFDMSRGRIPSRVTVERPPRNMQNMQAQLDREESRYSCFTTNSELIKKELGDDTFSLTSSSASFENDDDTLTLPTSSFCGHCRGSLYSCSTTSSEQIEEFGDDTLALTSSSASIDASIATFDMSRGQIPSRVTVEGHHRKLPNIQAQLERGSQFTSFTTNREPMLYEIGVDTLHQRKLQNMQVHTDQESRYSCFTTNSELIEEFGDDTLALAFSSASINASTATLDMSRGQTPSSVVIVEGLQLKVPNTQAQLERRSFSELIKNELGVDTFSLTSSSVPFENDDDTLTVHTSSEYYDFYGGTKELDRSSITSIGILLRTAADNLQMPDDISHFESKLKEDWFNEADHLKNRSVEFLARFMPWRLAEEVHKVVGGDV